MVYKSFKVAPEVLIPPTPLKKGGQEISKSPNLSGDLGGAHDSKHRM
jgi:hypothetical protein